jgi:ATP-binding cassette, subfamily C, bacterial CydD
VAFLSGFVLELAAALATALVAVEVGLRLLAGHMSYQTALLVLLLTPEAYLPLRAVGAQFHASTEGAAAARDVFEILETPAPQPSPANRPVDLRKDVITLTGITLKYPGRDRPALSGVNLTIRPGERLTLTGPSGAGKTSLLALLLRFAEPTAGHIEAGGTDLTAISLDEWRSQIAWVPQHPHLFATTVAANIALGRPPGESRGAASREDIAVAARAAGAAGFIEDLPQGYDTVVGERGLTLSSGQRQQIALARAFLRDAPLLLLDEPTAHLDTVSAAQLGQVIATLMAGRTVIQVTHGAGWSHGAGPVCTLDQGTLREAWPPVPPPALVPATATPARWM